MRLALCITMVLLIVGAAAWAGPSDSPPAPQAPKTSSKVSAAAGQSDMSDEDSRFEGEKRFRTNCGRCHQAPHKFPPRMMATIIRHMRVRSMITEQEMKLIVRYMTQ